MIEYDPNMNYNGCPQKCHGCRKWRDKRGKWITLREKAKSVEKSTWNHHGNLGLIKTRGGWGLEGSMRECRWVLGDMKVIWGKGVLRRWRFGLKQ